MADKETPSSNGNKLNLTILKVIAGILLFEIASGTLIAIYASEVAVIVIPLMVALLPLVIPGLLALIKFVPVETKIDKLITDVDGFTHEMMAAKESAAKANATLVERDKGEEKAEKLAVVTDEKLAEAQAAPAVGSVPTDAPTPVTVVNEVVSVDVVEKEGKAT